jgi:hypothetical protein
LKKFEEALRQYGFKDDAALALASTFYVPGESSAVKDEGTNNIQHQVTTKKKV